MARRLPVPWFSGALIAASAARFLADISEGGGHPWQLYGPAVRAGEWWRLLSYAIEHGNLIHIVVNMSVVWTLGFGLEHFDAVGAWRTADEGAPIDASGQLADGSRIDGVVALREALVRRPELFVGTLTEKLLTYALGRTLTHHDRPVVRALVRDAAAHEYRFSSIVLGIVHSTPFQMRMTQ